MNVPAGRIRPALTPRRTVGELAAQFDLTLAPSAPDGADAATEITSITLDDRAVTPGELFVALAGARAHGAQFAARAVARGARAVLTDAAGAARLRAEPVGVPVLVADDPRARLGAVAAWLYGEPAAALTTFAVTGTNGKTTTSYLLEAIQRALGRAAGLIGTVEIRAGDQVLPSRLTTPEAPDLQALLATMRESGMASLAMEVSSHALALHRVDGIVFDVAGFTNLSQDHLDFHQDMDQYFAAKAHLFTPAHARRGVVLLDDAWGERLAAGAGIPVAGLRVASAGPAQWRVRDAEPGPGGTAFTLAHADGRAVSTRVALPGAFNVANAALALAMTLEAGIAPADLDEALHAVGGLRPIVPGRMEVISPADPRVVVDFAHNPDALELALAALRPTTRGRLVLVFGATGDRDRAKRPGMGAVAARGADVVVVTDDDPHGEDPAPIRAEVLAGVSAALEPAATAGSGARPRAATVLEVEPRPAAIRRAILDAAPADTVLIAGRGHEVWQEIAGVDHPLDDRIEARSALAERAESAKE